MFSNRRSYRLGYSETELITKERKKRREDIRDGGREEVSEKDKSTWVAARREE